VKVRAAVLATMTKARLRTAIRAAEIEGVDWGDPTAMTLTLNQDPRVTASMLLRMADRTRLDEILIFLGLPTTTTFDELIELARIEDQQVDDSTDPATIPDADGGIGARVAVPGPSPDLQDIVVGALVSWEPHGLVGVVELAEHRRLRVQFDDGQRLLFSTEEPPLRRIRFSPGDLVTRGDGAMGSIQGDVTGQEIPTWKVWFGAGIANVAEMALRPAALVDPVERMRASQLGTAADFNLRAVAMDYWTQHRHNELVSLSNARVDLKPYQVSVVHRVVSNYPHRFLLCDEVGLGKTIEAAMIIKELRARGQAHRVLILAPSGLLKQWQFELKTKFNESFAIYNRNTLQVLRDKGEQSPWSATDSVIASHAWASWDERRRRQIAAVDWDLIVVDEAHHARAQKFGNSIRRTNLFRLVDSLIADRNFLRRGALLVTATPMQLHNYELYSLVEMLDPVLFASQQDFSQHVASLAGLRQLVERLETTGMPVADDRADFEESLARLLDIDAEDAAKLARTESAREIAARLRAHHRLSEVMIRNRKSQVATFQKRVAKRWEVHLSKDEDQVQQIMQGVFEEGWRLKEETNQNAVGFLMVILQKLLASSSRALLASLEKRRTRLMDSGPATDEVEAEEALEDDTEAAIVASEIVPSVDGEVGRLDEVIALLANIDIDSKARVLLANLTELFAATPEEKVLIFTEFRETQDMLAELLGRSWSVHKFHGQQSLEQKDSAVAAFRRGLGPQILVSTEAGGEGRNFQFCHVLVNYDLPWNPMKVEQRIGRLDRIGQEDTVLIFNLHVQGTIEGHILEVLEKRIKVFEDSVGALDPILGDTETDIRQALRLASEARDQRIKEIGERLEREVENARIAEREFGDFIMDAKSYKAEIVQKATGGAKPVSQEEFELFLERLLAWSHTWIGPRQDSGERNVEFHAPFTVEHPELFGGYTGMRVCLDPHVAVDSEYVEYLGFGHPIVDALVRRITEEKLDGLAAVRRIDRRLVNQPGWLFNWLVRVDGLRSIEFLYPVFVDDEGHTDESTGRELLRQSRLFPPEASREAADTSTLDEAYHAALEAVGRAKEERISIARTEAEERVAVEEARIEALFVQRTRAAEDRIRSCRATLRRFQASSDRNAQQVIPLWTANVARAEAELLAVGEDHEVALADIRNRSTPIAEFSLLNIARIEIATGEESA
jgi:SNF2 family DNA or RNA helicase